MQHTTATVVTKYLTVIMRANIANVHTVWKIMIAELPSVMQERFHPVKVIIANVIDRYMVIGSSGLIGRAVRAPVGMVR